MLQKYEPCKTNIYHQITKANARYLVNSQCFNDDPAIKLKEKLNALKDHKI